MSRPDAPTDVDLERAAIEDAARHDCVAPPGVSDTEGRVPKPEPSISVMPEEKRDPSEREETPTKKSRILETHQNTNMTGIIVDSWTDLEDKTTDAKDIASAGSAMDNRGVSGIGGGRLDNGSA